MTKREAAIVSAFTGILIGKFSDMHEYIEEVMDGPVMTHQLGNKEFCQTINDKSKQDFISIDVE